MYNHVHKIKLSYYRGIHTFQPQLLSTVQCCSALQVGGVSILHLQASNQLVPVHVPVIVLW